VSLGDFAFFNDKWDPRLEVAHGRNLQAMFWLTCGTIQEAIESLTEMEVLGVEGLLASLPARRPWLELRSTVRRWNEDPIYRRVRNKLSFHIDGRVIKKALNEPARNTEPVVWKRGNTSKDRSTVFTFAFGRTAPARATGNDASGITTISSALEMGLGS
jgi:hypothetical protein